ncbi:MAG: hypothetical protein JRM80_04950 [Nitrososphaerota archaeon]|nr:hypothetical protein [Nitrososphaerota archaeon]
MVGGEGLRKAPVLGDFTSIASLNQLAGAGAPQKVCLCGSFSFQRIGSQSG